MAQIAKYFLIILAFIGLAYISETIFKKRISWVIQDNVIEECLK